MFILRLIRRRVNNLLGGAGDSHPGADILQEDLSLIYQEDGSSTIQQEG